MYSQYSSFFVIVILFIVMYFLVIRPQKKRQQQHSDTLKQLSKGDHVVTIGRLHGVIDSINHDAKTVTLDCDGIYLVFDLNAIAKVTEKVAEAKADVAEDDSTKQD
jgi:preprotein translocase subunit YajC